MDFKVINFLSNKILIANLNRQAVSSLAQKNRYCYFTSYVISIDEKELKCCILANYLFAADYRRNYSKYFVSLKTVILA